MNYGCSFGCWVRGQPLHWVCALSLQAANVPFRRIRDEEVEVDPRLADNSFDAKVRLAPVLLRGATRLLALCTLTSAPASSSPRSPGDGPLIKSGPFCLFSTFPNIPHLFNFP